MTAFDDILKAEKEAEESIATAKKEVEEAITVAKKERGTKIAAETVKLDEAEKTALQAHQAQIDEKIQHIQKEVAVEVAAIEKKFESQKADWKATLKKKFA